MNCSLQKYNLSFIFSFSLCSLLTALSGLHAQKVFTILHIGDSHLQPNNLSGMTRYQLQKEFGNAGRGLIFPYTLAKTNGPKDYIFSSNVTWTSSWITKPTSQSIGLTGISIRSTTTSGAIKWSTGTDTLSYPSQWGKIHFQIEACQSCSVEVNGTKKNYVNKERFIDTLYFKILNDTSTIEFKGCTLTLLDLTESADQDGIRYHSTGVAGATFKTYNDNPHFEGGLQLLQPQLVVVSLGTNESVKKWDPLSFQKEVNVFIDRIKTSSPKARILLVLPNENYLKVNGVYTYNNRVDSVRLVLTTIAKERQIAIYDQQEAMGGKGCMLVWSQQGLVNEDHIHFLRKGYQKQGLLLANYIKEYLQTKQEE